MTRPRVDPEKRQRTATACDNCKRRKQKCDGNQPCPTCIKKQFTCTYNIPDQRSSDRSTSETQSRKRVRSDENHDIQGSLPIAQPLSGPVIDLDPWNGASGLPVTNGSTKDTGPFQQADCGKLEDGCNSEGDEEVDNHTMTRMLEDGTGRLVYIGDSADMSFLQLLRMIIENVTGPSPFSLDPGRNGLVDAQLSPLPDTQLTHQLPSKETALVLVNAFFINTHGLLLIFDESTFLATLDVVYSDPLTIDRIYLCHLNLVLAIGICLATPEYGSREATIVEIVRSKHPSQSEILYSNARHLSNPTTTLEDGDARSIQTLLLMAAYMMYKCKRNAAYSYIGMAVRTAYSLGLHREETLAIFPVDEQEFRKNLWRSLFVMDRFLATYLGRPFAIAEEECAGESLNPRGNTYQHLSELQPNQISSAGLEATVRCAHVIGLILRKVYRQRRISTKMAHSLADECRQWPASLSPALHWRRASSKNRRQAIASLHCNLAYCHSIVLLSRPFFLYLLRLDVLKTQVGDKPKEPSSREHMERFSDACIIASIHTIALIQKAYEGRYLPQMNSAATYTLFSAALIIFADQFARPSKSALSKRCMANAVSIMSYCGEKDPHSRRAAYILNQLRDVISQQEQGAFPQRQHQGPANQTPLPEIPSETYKPNSNTPIASQTFALTPSLDLTAGYSDFSFSDPSTFSDHDSFSGFLDITNNVLPSLSDHESSGPDEAIEFDTLLGEWPGFTSLPNLSVSDSLSQAIPGPVPAGTDFLPS
ncbi:hypothetical protein ACLMJK_008791 [Lecanora helva]